MSQEAVAFDTDDSLEPALRVLGVGEVTELPQLTMEQGEQVRFGLGFNKERLAQLDPAELVDPKTWGSEEKVERVREVLGVFAQLPERLQFEPGVTAIFGENGKGKTLLADVVVMSLKMQQFRQQHGLSRDADLFADDSGFYTFIPGHLTSSAHGNQDAQRQHAQLVARIADCVDVDKAVVHDLKTEVGDALRAPAALGDVTMGMSSRQAVDMLAKMQTERTHGKPSVKIYDEPELGMSPKRHISSLLGELNERVVDGSVELVPSNSPILYQSEVPRIDLDEPERGIYTPGKTQ